MMKVIPDKLGQLEYDQNHLRDRLVTKYVTYKQVEETVRLF